MIAKNILAIFIVSLFAPVVLAKPTTANEDHFNDFNLCKLKLIYAALAPAEYDNMLKPATQVVKNISYDIHNLALSYSLKAKNISELLLKDAVIASSKRPEIVKFKHIIEEYQLKYLACAEIYQLFHLVDFYSNVTSPYYEMANNSTLNADSRIIYDVLKKYSSEGLDAEYENVFLNKFYSKFGREINESKEKLEKSVELGRKLLQLWDQTKSMKTTKEKLAAFKAYVKLYVYVVLFNVE